MASSLTIKATIDTVLVKNGNKNITGPILHDVVKSMLDVDIRASGKITDHINSPAQGVVSADFFQRKLYDDAGRLSVDYNNRKLYHTDGTFIDWSGAGGFGGGGGTGSSGSSGSSGGIGANGSSGSSGANGANGLPGNSGSAGSSGSSGSAGSSGSSGAGGAAGSSGSSGLSGSSGSNGASGSSGSNGAVGTPGSAGSSGSSGSSGVDGANGSSGSSGSRGSSGSSGANGANGSSGSSGSSGANGANGSAGSSGSSGSTPSLPADVAYVDVQQQFTKSQASKPVQLTDASTIAVDMSLSNTFWVGLGGNRTLGEPTNCTAGQSGVIESYQGNGTWALSFAWCYQFPNGTAPNTSAVKFQKDMYVYYIDRSQTVTTSASSMISIATPAVITWTGHGLASGDIVRFSTTGSLPSHIATNTTYYINVINADTFNISTSLANLTSSTYVSTTGDSQSGNHTCLCKSITIYNSQSTIS